MIIAINNLTTGDTRRIYDSGVGYACYTLCDPQSVMHEHSSSGEDPGGGQAQCIKLERTKSKPRRRIYFQLVCNDHVR